jgi:hypothetical protein
MRRLLPLLIAAMAATPALLTGPASAVGPVHGGYDRPTRLLERAFKIALFERSGREDGCYPAPAALPKLFQEHGNLKTAVVRGFGGVRRAGVVHVLKKGTNCNRLMLATPARGKTYVLDSVRGPVYVRGGKKKVVDVGRLGKLSGLVLVTKEYRMSTPDAVERLEILCPGGRFPLGGGMIIGTPLGPDGEGIYPHSYERLGAQRGWHVSAVLIDPSNATTATHRVSIEALCARGITGEAIGPRKTVFLKSGQTKSVTVRCPAKTFLVSGGFQRTNFRTPGGNYITESRAVGSKAWRVSGRAFGDFGGELTAMAYCVRHKGRILTEVSGSTALAAGQSATATTPPCPKGRRLVTGGFSADGSPNAFFAGSSLNPDGTTSATGFGYFGPAPSFTAYGYCARA